MSKDVTLGVKPARRGKAQKGKTVNEGALTRQFVPFCLQHTRVPYRSPGYAYYRMPPRWDSKNNLRNACANIVNMRIQRT